MARHKVRKGKGGRTGMKGMSTTPASSGKVLYCERCCQTGMHRTVREVRTCHGRPVVLGVDFRWVRPL